MYSIIIFKYHISIEFYNKFKILDIDILYTIVKGRYWSFARDSFCFTNN